MARLTAIAGTAGALVIAGALWAGMGGGSDLLADGPSAEDNAFMTECMEAELLWKEDSMGWRLAATPQERAAVRGHCSAASARGEATPAMLDVRAGKLTVRESEAEETPVYAPL